MSDPTRTRLPSWLVGSGVIAVGMGVMNVANYAFTVVAARLLGPHEYGAVAALMGLMLVLGVLSLGLQATGARRLSAHTAEPARLEPAIMRAGWWAAGALFLVTVAASPLLSRVLRLDGPAPLLLLAVATVPLTLLGAQAGILQGERRWWRLALVYAVAGLGRIGFGTFACLWHPDATAAMLGVAAGAVVPTLLAGRLVTRRPVSRGVAQHGRHSEVEAVGVLREIGHNSHAILGFIALSNVDVLVARTVLSEQQSGLYAAGLIVTKAVLFLPQFVVVLAFPSMASRGGHRRRELVALGSVLAMGAVATLVTAVLDDLAIVFVGGDAYAELASSLWVFAAVGTVLAMQQFVVYGSVARQSRAAIVVLWLGVLSLVLLGPLTSSYVALVGVVAALQVTVLAALLALSWRGDRPLLHGRAVDQLSDR